jgi:DNA polymerase epsilon subunit 1
VRDKRITVKFIISKKPIDAMVADRAIPTNIFDTDEQVTKKMLRKWLKDSQL